MAATRRDICGSFMWHLRLTVTLISYYINYAASCVYSSRRRLAIKTLLLVMISYLPNKLLFLRFPKYFFFYDSWSNKLVNHTYLHTIVALIICK